MDLELFQTITAHASTSPEIRVLDTEEAEQLSHLVAERFGFPLDRIWWWEVLPDDAVAVPYEGQQGLDRLLEVLPYQKELLLFVTDDMLPPWPCVSGTSMALVNMLRELRFFEYFVVDSELKWIVFDNHHNVLFALGRPLHSPEG